MDQGSKLDLVITIDSDTGSAIFDFEKSDPEAYGNLNAPMAVSYSAVIYCLRCLIGYDIPLNQGCLNPVQIKLRRGSILFPSDEAAVVGGNVLTSQRVVDVVFKVFISSINGKFVKQRLNIKAFEAAAASCGCMNNFCFGDGSVGYYETICGGAGAGPGWQGTSAIHTHMTNTRITDVEILEKRYAILVDEFSIREGSGGKGEFTGGAGVKRQFQFRKPQEISLLTERRVNAPFGLKGGEDGERGKNLIIRQDGHTVGLPPKCQLNVASGERICLLTPGAGGYGKAKRGSSQKRDKREPIRQSKERVKNLCCLS